MTMVRLASLIGLVLLTSACGSDDSAAGSGGSGGTTGGAGGTSGAGGAATGGVGGAWGCVGSVSYPPAPAPTLDIVRRFYHMYLPFDSLDSAPFEGVTVDVCKKGTDCSSPDSSTVTDAQGDAHLTLSTPGLGFDGFLRVRGTNMVTMDLHMLPPLADATSRYLDDDWKPVVFLETAWEAFAKDHGAPSVDPAKGHVIASTMNCNGSFSAEVLVTMNGQKPAMSAYGDNAFFNVEPGSVDVVGTVDGNQVAHVTGTVVAGRILALNFGPTP